MLLESVHVILDLLSRIVISLVRLDGGLDERVVELEFDGISLHHLMLLKLLLVHLLLLHDLILT